MKKIKFPENWTVDEWYGFNRHHFDFEGCSAWIAEPKYPAGDGRWSWCMAWPESFIKRVGIVALLEHGFYHVYIDTFQFRASPQGVAIMGRFQVYLQNLGLSSKVNLIGKSWGGFFSLRYAETFPERIAALYLDAPLCNAADPKNCDEDRTRSILENFGLSLEEMKVSKLNPLNNTAVLVKAQIPIMAVVGEADLSVNIDTNFNILEKRILESGGKLKVIRRKCWGHHPHGLDDPEELLKFHCEAREY
ncbi:MAG: alpha/beta fold hydrolase [Lentisphaeria bacterium]|nr:alpha/beta fold hydrolase [Lentisphaeria bacterium]